jgi:hypothetical protein
MLVRALLVCASVACLAGCGEGAGDGGAAPGTPATDPTGGFADSGTYLRDVWTSTSSELSSALAAARPGDRIILPAASFSGGVYRSGLKGTAENPIMIAGDAAGGTSISGGGECMHLADPEYVVIQDLELSGSSQNGLNIDDGGTFDTPAHHVVLRNLTVHDIGGSGNQDGIKLSGVDHFLIEDCEISRSGGGSSGSGIDMVGCHHGTIRGCFFHDSSGNAIQAKGGSEDVLIWRNRFERAGERALNLGGSTGAAYFRPQGADYEARDLRAVANTFADCKAPVAFVGCDGALFANNTVYLPRTWVARILQESVDGFIPCRDGRFVNNVVVFRKADLSTYVNVGPNTAPETFTFSHDLWHCLDDAGFTGPSLPVVEAGGTYQEDPLFAAPALSGGDFHVGRGSPAAGAGVVLGEVPGDYDGRPYASPPTVGAFEAAP